MKCVIPGQNVKFFGKSIHCLSRIGDELFFEALEDGLALRTVNSSRSAYACFVFNKSFLDEYDQGVDQIEGSDPTELLKCKITMKSVLAIFKSLSTIEKIVDRCKIVFQPDRCRLVFVLHCKHGIIKTHNLTYQECESLQAVFGKEFCPNNITAQHKVLQDAVGNFPTSCEEITVSVCPEYVKITNYIEDEPDLSKVVHTVMTLVPEEFDHFRIGIDTKITFCLKELRAILAFSEYVNQPLSLHFEQAGRPIVFCFENNDLYTGNFVMATLSENDAPTPSSQQGTQVNASQYNRDDRTTKENQNTANREKHTAAVNKPTTSTVNVRAANSNTKRNHSEIERDKNRIKNNNVKNTITEQKRKENETMSQNISSIRSTTKNISNNRATPVTLDLDDPADDFFSESFPYKKGIFGSGNNASSENSQKSHIINKNYNNEQKNDKYSKKERSNHTNNILNDERSKQNDRCSNDERSNRSIFDTAVNMDDVSAVMTDDEDGDVLGGTPPPAKKKMFKSIFFGDSSSSVSNSQRNISANRTVLLAADTDDEEDD